MFARTERLLLRPGWPEDAGALACALGDQAVAFRLARLPWPYALANAEAWLGRERSAYEADFVILLRTPVQPTLIGGVGLADREGAVELGYWIAREHWGCGYATEEARAVVEIARETLRIPRLTSGHFADNPASGAVLRKLGFTVTGEEARHCLAQGRDLPCVTLALDLNEPALAA